MYYYDPVSCDRIDINYVDKKVYITGMIDSIRRQYENIIINIRDRNGTIQAVINPKIIESGLYEKAFSLEEKKLITICGSIEYRDVRKINPEMKTGRLELIADDYFLINPDAGSCNKNTPYFMQNQHVDKYSSSGI